MEVTGLEDVASRLHAALESLDEIEELVESISSGRARVINICSIHKDHRGFMPAMAVTYVEFQAHLDARKVQLDCGHALLLPDEMQTGKGELLPCVYCAEECNW